MGPICWANRNAKEMRHLMHADTVQKALQCASRTLIQDMALTLLLRKLQELQLIASLLSYLLQQSA